MPRHHHLQPAIPFSQPTFALPSANHRRQLAPDRSEVTVACLQVLSALHAPPPALQQNWQHQSPSSATRCTALSSPTSASYAKRSVNIEEHRALDRPLNLENPCSSGICLSCRCGCSRATHVLHAASWPLGPSSDDVWRRWGNTTTSSPSPPRMPTRVVHRSALRYPVSWRPSTPYLPLFFFTYCCW